MGYVVLVTLKESISEPEVDEVLSQMLGINSVVSVTPEWRSDRKRKRVAMSERQTSRDHSPVNENSKNYHCCHDENDDFDTKLMSLFENPRDYPQVKNEIMDTDTDYEIEDKIDVIVKKHSPPPTNGPGRPKKKRTVSPTPVREIKEKKEKKNKEVREKEMEKGKDEDTAHKTPKEKSTATRVECQKCKKDVQLLQLRWHAATHCERKQYKCAKCEFSGNIPQVMRNHVIQKHEGTEPVRGKDYLDDLDEKLKTEWIRISAECFPAYAEITRSHIEKNRRRVEG